MENIKKNYRRIFVLLIIAIVYLFGLYTVFLYFDDAFDTVGQDGFALALFGGFLVIGAMMIFFMMYVFAALLVLSFVFATIARFTYTGDVNKLGTYRGLMITTYVFLILTAIGMLLCSGMMVGIVGFVLAIAYTVFLIINMVTTFKTNVVDTSMYNTYYNPNMYYNQNMYYNNQSNNYSNYNQNNNNYNQ